MHTTRTHLVLDISSSEIPIFNGFSYTIAEGLAMSKHHQENLSKLIDADTNDKTADHEASNNDTSIP